LLGLMLGLLLLTAHVPRAHAANEAFIRIVHGSPDAPAVNVYINGNLTFEALKFTVISPYVPTRIGTTLVQIVPQGATLVQGPIVLSATVNTRAGQEYSLIAMGKVAKIAPLMLEDDNTIGDPSKAKLRLVHLSPDSPAVDIVTGQDDQKLFANAAYKTASRYIEVDPAQYSFVIRPAETSVNKLDVRGLVLDASTVTTVYMFGLWSNTPKLSVGTSQDLRPQIILPETGGMF
jgi:hypothetical protein